MQKVLDHLPSFSRNLSVLLVVFPMIWVEEGDVLEWLESEENLIKNNIKVYKTVNYIIKFTHTLTEEHMSANLASMTIQLLSPENDQNHTQFQWNRQI